MPVAPEIKNPPPLSAQDRDQIDQKRHVHFHAQLSSLYTSCPRLKVYPDTGSRSLTSSVPGRGVDAQKTDRALAAWRALQAALMIARTVIFQHLIQVCGTPTIP